MSDTNSDEYITISKEEYLHILEFSSNTNGDISKRYDIVMDIRKFEIEMYWKRATYFWLFMGVCFAGFKFSESANSCFSPTAFAISCLGLFVAVAFWLVNRGSKFWQENWEAHVDLLEDEVVGNLYKTVISSHSPKCRLEKIVSAAPYSVSKINMAISFALIIFWVFIIIEQCFSQNIVGLSILFIVFLLGICYLLIYCKSQNISSNCSKFDETVFYDDKLVIMRDVPNLYAE